MATHLALSRTVTEISTGAAAIAVTLALAIGWYGAKWHRAEVDEIKAREGLAGAVKAMWAARKVLAVVVIVGGVLLDLWFRGQGRR